MKSLLIATLLILMSAGSGLADSAPASVVGYVIVADQRSSEEEPLRVTFDSRFTYFGDGEVPEAYTYRKLSKDSFSVTNFDPDHPLTEWSHLLFQFTNTTSGTVFDQDEAVFKATFELLPPSAASLRILPSTPATVVVESTSQKGQMIVLQESTDLTAWTSFATNILWTGHWELSVPASLGGRNFFRAYVPTE